MSLRFPSAASVLSLVVPFGIVGWGNPAAAVEARVTSASSAQSYAVRSPFGDPILRRRRFTQTLGLGLYDLEGNPSGEAIDVSFDARLRLDADFGQLSSERDPNASAHFVPGLAQAPLDVMFAYFQANGLLDDTVRLRLGRQVMSDTLGWWSFDGVLLRVDVPVHLALEAVAGFEQRGGLPLLSSARYERDGVWRGDRFGIDAERWTAFLDQSRPAPAWGLALETTDLGAIQARLSYRRVLQRDTVRLSPYNQTASHEYLFRGQRVSSDRLGLAAHVGDPKLGMVAGQAVYDLFLRKLTEYRASLDWVATGTVTLGADGDVAWPSFDADSIFNAFAARPVYQAVARAVWQANRTVGVSMHGGARVLTTQGDPQVYAVAQEDERLPDRAARSPVVDQLVSIRTTARSELGVAELESEAEVGDSGHLIGTSLRSTRDFEGGLYDVRAICSVYSFRGALQPDRDAVSFTYVLGGGMRPFDTSHLGVEWEHSMNRLVGQRFRALATLELAFR